jgi:hypothetical protein
MDTLYLYAFQAHFFDDLQGGQVYRQNNRIVRRRAETLGTSVFVQSYLPLVRFWSNGNRDNEFVGCLQIHSAHTAAFTRIRDAVALRTDNSFDFEPMRSRQGRANAGWSAVCTPARCHRMSLSGDI